MNSGGHAAGPDHNTERLAPSSSVDRDSRCGLIQLNDRHLTWIQFDRRFPSRSRCPITTSSVSELCYVTVDQTCNPLQLHGG